LTKKARLATGICAIANNLHIAFGDVDPPFTWLDAQSKILEIFFASAVTA